MATFEQWANLMSPNSSVEDARPILPEALSELESALAPERGGVEGVLAILHDRVRTATGAGWFPSVDAHLGTYSGPDVALLLVWLAQPIGSPTSPTQASERVAAVSELASPEVAAAVRTILGRYGKELWDSYDLWNQVPDDWRSVSHNVYLDQVTGRYLMRVRVQKYNGQEALVEGPPQSILGLIQAVLSSLQNPATRDAIPAELLRLYFDQTEQWRRSIEAQAEASSPTAAADHK